MALKFLCVEFFLPNVGEIFVTMQRAKYQGTFCLIYQPPPYSTFPFFAPPLMSVFSSLVLHLYSFVTL